MASRYRVSMERAEQNKKATHLSESHNLVNYEPSPEPTNLISNSSRTMIDDVPFLHARLRYKSQIERKLRQKVDTMAQAVESWKGKYNSKVDQCSYLKDELARTRKRCQEEVDEVNRELRWNRKKVKALEAIIEENHNNRLPRTVEIMEAHKRLREANDVLIEENTRLSELQEGHARQHEKLISELEQLKEARNEDMINIQNLENAVKSLHDENIILKETPIPVVLPTSRPGQQELGHQLFRYPSQRPALPCVSLIDRRAQEKRRDSDLRHVKLRSISSPKREVWPYSSSSEDISWGQ